MNKFFLIILIILLLVNSEFSLYEQEKFHVSQYYDITFKVYKYSDEDRLNCKEFFCNKKGELLLKKSITVWEDKCYIEEFTISKSMRIILKFDFKGFLISKIYINDKESIVFQDITTDFKLDFKASQKEIYHIETSFMLGCFGSIRGGIRIDPQKITKKKIF